MCLKPVIIKFTRYTVPGGTASRRLLVHICLGLPLASTLPVMDCSTLAMITASLRHVPESFRDPRCHSSDLASLRLRSFVQSMNMPHCAERSQGWGPFASSLIDRGAATAGQVTGGGPGAMDGATIW
jgi:hypothetical protein